MNQDIPEIINAIRQATGTSTEALNLHEPTLSQIEIDEVTKCIKSGWVSYNSPTVDKFEKILADYCGVAHAVCVSSGTSALQIALMVAGVKPNDEVLVPNITFIATANAVNYCGAIPNLVDVEASNFNLDPKKLTQYLKDISVIKDGVTYNKTTGRRISAILPVHIFGCSARMDELIEVAQEWRLKLVEDASEALGSYYERKHLGTFGDLGVLSFNGNKIITTGGGGAILTESKNLASRAKHLSTTAKLSHAWEFNHDEIGFNYRLPGVNAAIGIAQLSRIDTYLEQKRALAAAYGEVFATIKSVRYVEYPKNSQPNFWLNAIQLSKRMSPQRNALLKMANESQVHLRPIWRSIGSQPMYSNTPRMDLSVSERIASEVICLPSSPFLAKA